MIFGDDVRRTSLDTSNYSCTISCEHTAWQWDTIRVLGHHEIPRFSIDTVMARSSLLGEP